MNRFLITGARGALGQSLINRLQELPTVTILGTSRNTSDSEKNFVFCDLLDETAIKSLVNDFKPTCIFHLAANFSNDIDKCLALNVQVPLRILQALEQSKSRCRVVLIGSAAEYGLVKPEENPITELQPLRPVSPYGYSKSCQSQLISLFQAQGVDVVGARIFNLWGAEMSDRLFVGRVQAQISEIVAGTRSHLEIGTLDAYRDYISVAEASEWLLRIAHHGLGGEIYHVASAEPIQMRVLLEKMLQQHGLDMSCILESSEHSNRSGYDVPIIFADMSKSIRLPAL